MTLYYNCTIPNHCTKDIWGSFHSIHSFPLVYKVNLQTSSTQRRAPSTPSLYTNALPHPARRTAWSSTYWRHFVCCVRTQCSKKSPIYIKYLTVLSRIYGITCLQVYLYYSEHSFRDRLFLKIFVSQTVLVFGPCLSHQSSITLGGGTSVSLLF
jgi:hypothetical protein